MQETHEQIDQWTSRVIRVTYEFSGFPREVAQIIAGYCATEQKLREWIDPSKLDRVSIYANPIAFSNGMLNMNNLTQNKYPHIAQNPAAADFLKSTPSDLTCSDFIWQNPELLDWLVDKHNLPIKWYFLAQNQCERAVKMVLSNPIRYNDFLLMGNPFAIAWIRSNMALINVNYICGNSAAVDLIQELEEIDYHWLSVNPHPWAIEQLRLNQNKIDWHMFSTNPSIFEWYTNQELVAQLTRK